MAIPDWMGDDELNEDDLAFLEQWGQMGAAEKNETGDLNTVEDYEGHEAEGDFDIEGVEAGAHDGESDEQSDEVDEDSDNGGASGESDSVDESRMDISQADTGEDKETSSSSSDEADERDHLEGGDSDSDIPEGESDMEYDDLEYEGEDDGDASGGKMDDDDPDYGDDDYVDAQTPDDDGDGERTNSDEARESDDPLEGNYEEDEQEQEVNAQGDEDYEGDAQQELEDHLEENNSQPSDEEGDEEEQIRYFEGLPERRPQCNNHCEDSGKPKGEGDPDEECACCAERIERERELWGVIGKDLNGDDVYPGDKLLVTVPIGLIQTGAIVTANVPNDEIDPPRLAVKMPSREVNEEKCWLSGKISQFTGWRMSGANNPIWVFNNGDEIPFAEKIGETHRNEGQQYSEEEIEEKVKDMMDDLDQIPETENDEADIEAEEEIDGDAEDDSADEDEEATGDDDDDEASDEAEESEDDSDEKDAEPLTNAQMGEFLLYMRRLQKATAGFFDISEVPMGQSGPVIQMEFEVDGVTYGVVAMAKKVQQ